MQKWKTKSSGETQTAAEQFAKQLTGGDLVLLRGEMGVGKTVFTKGLCRALGVTDYVTSPTFTVVNEYQGTDFPVYHFDLYRIEDEDELLEIGFEEYLQSGGVCVIEWPQNAKRSLPQHRYEVEIKRGDDADERLILVDKI
jgi:tRNA threonylcarbamoyladenosine biosynthesis protein TsaE